MTTTNNITRKTTLTREALDEHAYFASLMREALRLGLIDADFAERTRAQALTLCRALLLEQARGRSTSVRAELVSEMMDAIVYTLDAALQRYPEPDDALAALGQDGVDALFASGRKRIARMTQSARIVYGAMRPYLLDTDNHTYQATYRGGLAGFFKLYAPEYAPHKTHITADYPVCFYPDGMRGIAFIRAYMDNWRIEDRVCAHLDRQGLRGAIALYAMHYGETTKELTANLYLIALAMALACALAGADITSLVLPEADKPRVRAHLSEPSCLADARTELFAHLSLSDPERAYVLRTIDAYATDLKRMIGVFADAYDNTPAI